MDVGEIRAVLTATAESLKAAIDGVKADIQNMAKDTKQQIQNASQSANQIANANKKIADTTKNSMSEMTALSITLVATFYGIVRGIQDVTTAANTFHNSLLGLDSTATSFKIDLTETTRDAQILTAAGLMGIQDAATGIKNLLMAGFGLDQAVTLMNRFKDSAAFGRQGALGFGEAIRTATEGIKNGNSILVDNAGVTKNLSIMLEEAGYSAQDLSKASTDAGVRQAIFNGILRETSRQSGDAAKLAGTLSGQMSQFSTSANLARVAVGDALAPALQDFYSVLSVVTKGITDFTNTNPELVSGIITVITSITGLIAVFTILSILLPKIKAGLELLNSTMLKSPWGWILLAIGAVIGVVYNLIAANEQARQQQGKYNQTLEETNKIRREGIQISEVEQRQAEILQLQDLINKYDQFKNKQAEIKKQLDKGVGIGFNETDAPKLQDAYAKADEEIAQLEKSLMDLGYSYDSAKERVNALAQAIDRAKAVDTSAVQAEAQKYQQLVQTNQKIQDAIDLYTQLANKQNRTADENRKLASTAKFLIDVFGQEIVAKTDVNGVSQLSIEMLKQEAVELQNSTDAQKEASRQKIDAKKAELEAERTRVQETISLLQKEMQAYLGQYRAFARSTESDDIAMADALSGMMDSNRKDLQANYAQIKAIEDAVSELGNIRAGLEDTKIYQNTDNGSSAYANKEIDNALTVLNYKKSINQLTLQDEIATLENIKSQYAKTTEEQMQLDQLIYDAKQRLQQDTFDKAKAYIDDEVYYNRMSKEEQLTAWQQLRDQYAQDTEFYKEADKQVYQLRKDLQDEYVSQLDSFGNQVVIALRSKYQEAQKAEEDALNKDLSNLDNWKDKSIDRINTVYDRKIQVINDEITALDKQKQAQDRANAAEEYNTQVKNIQDRINRATDPLQRFSLQQQLDELNAKRQKVLDEETLADKKESLNNQKDLLEEKRQAEIDSINSVYESQKTALQNSLTEVKEYYQKKLDAANLNAEAEKLIVDKSQQDLVDLLNAYAPDWMNAGKSFGENLIAGINSTKASVQAAVNDLLSLVGKAKNLASSALSSSNTASGVTSGNTTNTQNVSYDQGIYVDNLVVQADDVLAAVAVQDGLRQSIRKNL